MGCLMECSMAQVFAACAITIRSRTNDTEFVKGIANDDVAIQVSGAR